MRTKLLFAFLALALSITSAKAEIKSGSCGTNVTWTLNTDTGLLKIEGTGAMKDYTSTMNIVDYTYYSSSPWDRYRSKILNIEITDGVTTFGNNAFYNCENLNSIIIPSSLTRIGDGAFHNCHNLTYVHISDLEAWCKINFSSVDSNPLSYSNNLYINNERITNLVIPNTITSIRNWAFMGYKSLTSVTIPSSVTSIGEYAFQACRNLTTITIHNSLRNIGTRAFCDCTSLKAVHITDIAAWCKINFGSDWSNPLSYAHNLYINNELVTNLVIPGSVTSIGNAFRDCTCITSVTISKGVKSIGNSAFWGCSGLTSVTIPNSVTSIGASAFRDCSSLTSITIPGSVTSIGGSAFWGCSGLTSVTIPNSVTSIGSLAFLNCTSLTSITIPNSVTSIGDRAFSGCTSLPVIDNLRYADTYLVEAVDKNLSTYNIKAGIKFIGGSAFNGCSSLTSITIPNGVTSIGSYAFYYCSSLTSITIPNSVTSIGEDAFSDCTNLNDVICLATTPPTIYNNTFSKYGTLHVLPGCKAAYEAANYWKYFFTIVEDAEDPGLSGTCGPNLTWVLDTSTGLLRIMGTGAMYNYDSSSSPWYNYRSAIKIVEIADGVTSIGTEAFTDCSNLNDITCLATTPPTIYDTPFSSYTYNGTLHVLPGCKAAYEVAEYWKDFFNIAEDAKETAIESLKAEPSVRSSEIFDLSGRKVQQGHKGIVIQNGKKILVK